MANTTKTLDDLKFIIGLNRYIKIEPTDIKIGVLNFSHGKIEEYDFTAEYVSKIPWCNFCHGENDRIRQTCHVYGVIHYASGASYKVSKSLTYTDEVYIGKLYDAIGENKQQTRGEVWDEIKMYN